MPIHASSTSPSVRTTVNCAHWLHSGVIGGGCCTHPEQPHGKRPSRGVCRGMCQQREPANKALPHTHQRPTLRNAVAVAKPAARATKSVAKTSLGIDRATDKQVEARLNVCRRCPDNHAVIKDGDVHTCGPMLESMKGNGEGTCGCILRRKARDLTEDCPFEWWPKPEIGTTAGSG